MNPTNLELPVKLAEKLKLLCDDSSDNHEFIALSEALGGAIEFCNDQNIGKPLVISLIGGTGTGKSLIFSKLCGQESASPSSDSVRGFTRKLYVAAGENDRPFLRLEPDSVILPGIIENIVLIDTPDLDTIHRENAALTQRIIQDSDILVYVTSPDKRSNFDIHQTILQWASRKRWFFAMNKIDTCDDTDIDRLKKDFSKKIASLGFTYQEKHCFLFSARDQDSFAFRKFKDGIFSKRNQTQNRLIREAAGLRQILHATRENSAYKNLKQLYLQVNSQTEILKERLMQIPAQVLASETIEHLSDQIRTSQVYRQLLLRRTGFIFPYIWANSRLSPSGSAIEISGRISEAITAAKTFQDCRNDEARILQDLGLEKNAIALQQPDIELQLTQRIKTNLSDSANEVSNSGQIGLYLFLANLLPLIILLQALYRAFSHWLAGIWLPSDFFVHAAIIITGATLPGYLLVSKGIQRISSARTIGELNIVLTPERIMLSQQKLETLIKETEGLKSHCEKKLRLCESQIDHENGAILSAPEK